MRLVTPELDRQLFKYSQSHRHPFNIAIHWLCIPAIMFSLFGLLWSIPFPSSLLWLNWATLFIASAMVYYLRFSIFLALIMFLVSMSLLYGVASLSQYLSVIQTSLTVFAIAWVGQFIGHYIEGKKPSFMEDIRSFLIGPLWLVVKALRKLKIVS